MRIAFYAPLKSPDHPVPSGDRQMARLLVRALRASGHGVEIVSTLRSFMAEPQTAGMQAMEAAAAQESARIATQFRAAGLPDLWFTYHPFYKAPDLLGPGLARRFGLPYVTAEASDAPKRADGPWSGWHAINQAAIRAGAMHLCFTARDRAGVSALLGSTERLVDLPPFIDAAPVRLSPAPKSGPVRLIAIAMMRPGDKLRSYSGLAQALERLRPELAWSLSVGGDGPAREAVRNCFAGIRDDRLNWLGLLDASAVQAHLDTSDLFVWPGHNEAYGIAYLEAGARGLPVVAFDSGGVASVVRSGETGLLVPDGDVAALAEALDLMISDAGLRRRYGSAARAFVTTERNLAAATRILEGALDRVSCDTVPA